MINRTLLPGAAAEGRTKLTTDGVKPWRGKIRRESGTRAHDDAIRGTSRSFSSCVAPRRSAVSRLRRWRPVQGGDRPRWLYAGSDSFAGGRAGPPLGGAAAELTLAPRVAIACRASTDAVGSRSASQTSLLRNRE